MSKSESMSKQSNAIYSGNILNLQSTITCPNCRFEKEETMPVDACVYFYECQNCKMLIKPLQGDCCVFCSFGNVKCPSKQTGESCC